MKLVSGDAFGALFGSFEHTAFRLELRERYDSPGEREPLRRFLAGEPDDLAWNRSWLALMAEHAAAGRVVRRVRVVSVVGVLPVRVVVCPVCHRGRGGHPLPRSGEGRGAS